MVKASQNTAKTVQLPRTISKKALRSYFDVSGHTFRKFYYTPDLRQKLGVTNSRQDRHIKTFTIQQTKIIIDHFQLSTEELEIIGSYM